MFQHHPRTPKKRGISLSFKKDSIQKQQSINLSPAYPKQTVKCHQHINHPPNLQIKNTNIVPPNVVYYIHPNSNNMVNFASFPYQQQKYHQRIQQSNILDHRIKHLTNKVYEKRNYLRSVSKNINNTVQYKQDYPHKKNNCQNPMQRIQMEKSQKNVNIEKINPEKIKNNQQQCKQNTEQYPKYKQNNNKLDKCEQYSIFSFNSIERRKGTFRTEKTITEQQNQQKQQQQTTIIINKIDNINDHPQKYQKISTEVTHIEQTLHKQLLIPTIRQNRINQQKTTVLQNKKQNQQCQKQRKYKFKLQMPKEHQFNVEGNIKMKQNNPERIKQIENKLLEIIKVCQRGL